MSVQGPFPGRAPSSHEPGDLARRARRLVSGTGRAVLGITGSPGAGKTTLAQALTARLLTEPPPVTAFPAGAGTEEAGPEDTTAGPWVAHVPMDGFHLADAELDRLGRRDRKGAPDTFDAAGYAALLRRLRDGDDGAEVIYAPGFERVLEQPIAGALPVPRSTRLIITEGNYLLLDDGDWARVRPLLDEVWFCAADEEERVRRLVARHERFGKEHGAAVAWALGPDQRNADTVARTRERADLVLRMG